MTKARLRVALAMASIQMGLAGGCSAGRQAAMELDEVAHSVERYGFAGISAPFLSSPQPDLKTLDLNKSASYFFDHALTSVQGGVRTSDSMAIDAQVALRINIEQALATVAQYNRAKTIDEVKSAQRKAGVQKRMLETLVGSATPSPAITSAITTGVGTAIGAPPGTPGGAALAALVGASNPADNPLVKSTLGMLDVIATSPLPDEDPLPGFEASTEAPPDKPPFSKEDREALQAVGSFTALRGFPEQTFQISAREALLIANGDWTTQFVLNWLEYPLGNRMGDYELFFCPMIVSVKPGYETRQGYLADVSMSVDLARKRPGQAGKLEFLSEQFPSVDPPVQIAGVLPVIDSQVLDEVSSRRRLYSLAFQLAAVGFGAQANVFIDYARKLEQDAQTRTALTVASAYTAGGATFGFRVEPQFVALKNATTLDAQPGKTLQSRTFPALAMLLVHRSYLNEKGVTGENQFNVGGSPDSILASHRKATGDAVETVNKASANPGNKVASTKPAEVDGSNKYQYLVLRSSVHWSPVEAGWLNHPARRSEIDGWKTAQALDKAALWLDPNRKGALLTPQLGVDSLGSTVPAGYQRAHLSSRLLSLRQLALDTQALIRIDHTRPKSEVTVTNVEPERGWLDQPTTITITGTGFKNNVAGVTIGGRACETQIVSDECLVAKIGPWMEATTSGLVLIPPTQLDDKRDMAPTGSCAEETVEFSGEVVLVSRVSVVDESASRINNGNDDELSPRPASRGAEEKVSPIVVGRILFTRQRPKPPTKPAEPKPDGPVSIQIHRDPGTGQISGITTDKDYQKSLELLDRLKPMTQQYGGEVRVKVEAHVDDSSKNTCPSTQPAQSKD